MLDKLRLNTRKEEAKALAAKGGVDDNIIVLPPSALIAFGSRDMGGCIHNRN